MAAGPVGISPCRRARGPVGIADLALPFVPSAGYLGVIFVMVPFGVTPLEPLPFPERSASALRLWSSTSFARFSNASFSRCAFGRNLG